MVSMTDLNTRHGFLAALHELLRPRVYLEIGVQHGTSLKLAHAAEVAYGIDPKPLITQTGNQQLVHATSDDFFGAQRGLPNVDLAFIDGLHLVENALLDFANVERLCHAGSVVVFDDVLPRNQHEARRLAVGEPVVGDWTGDVWKVFRALEIQSSQRAIVGAPSLKLTLVNVQPTGLLVVTGFDPERRPTRDWANRMVMWIAESATEVPEHTLNRTQAFAPIPALERITEYLPRSVKELT